MKKRSVTEQLEARIAAGRRGEHLTEQRDAELLDEYLSAKPHMSFRALAAKHRIGVNTVARAVRRAAERRDS